MDRGEEKPNGLSTVVWHASLNERELRVRPANCTMF
jgi:hypothetical protein